MTQRLHLVFGGVLIDPSKNAFKDVDAIDIVGMFPDYATAYNAWKGAAQRTVDNAHMRYFIAHIHRLRDEETPASPTEELGS
jgi:hypothetical protein